MPDDKRLSELIQRTPNGQEFLEVIIPPFTPGTNRKVLLQDIVDMATGGGGTVTSVTGTASRVAVDNTNPATPVIDIAAAYDTAVTNAINAKVADAINDGTTTIAPSQNAVFDALALKAPLASPALTGTPTAPTAAQTVNNTQLASTDFVQNRVLKNGFVASGTNTYTVTVPGIAAYRTGDVFTVNFTNTNTAESTLNVNSLGAIPLKKNANIFLTSGDLVPGQAYGVYYDGTNFELINSQLVRRIYYAEAYGAKHDYRTVSDANVTSGTATLTSATAAFTTNDTGKTIRVSGAGAAGVDLITTITFVNATTVTLGVNASTTIVTKKIEWGTNDTAAIQNAIGEAVLRGGGVVYLANGIYFIAGALVTSVDGVNPNAQIFIPLTTTSETKVTVEIIGESAIMWPSGPFAAQNLPTKGVILKSIITGSGTTPTVIGSSFAFDGFVNGNVTSPIFRNICIMTKSMEGTAHIAPTMSAAVLYNCGSKQVYNCIAITESDPTESILPVAVTYGWWLDQQGHTDVHSIYQNVTASGYYYGFRREEHGQALSLAAYTCLNAVAIGGQSTGSHPILNMEVIAHWCKYGVTFLANKTVDITYYAERWPGSQSPSYWFDGTADFYVPSTVAIQGQFKGNALNAGGAVANLVVSGTYTGSVRVIDYQAPYITTLGGKSPSSTNANAGNGFNPGDVTSDPAYLEINRGIVSGGTDKGFAVLALVHEGQSGTTDATVGSIQCINKASGDADKRLYSFSIATGGAVDAGKIFEFLNSGSGLVQIREVTSSRYNFGIPCYFGSNTTVPSARIHIAAGSATAGTAPIKFTSGTVTTAAVAGQMEYNNTFHLTNSDGTRRHVTLCASATKTTAGAPYANDGYVTINIGGTDVRVMTTA